MSSAKDTTANSLMTDTNPTPSKTRFGGPSAAASSTPVSSITLTSPVSPTGVSSGSTPVVAPMSCPRTYTDHTAPTNPHLSTLQLFRLMVRLERYAATRELYARRGCEGGRMVRRLEVRVCRVLGVVFPA